MTNVSTGTGPLVLLFLLLLASPLLIVAVVMFMNATRRIWPTAFGFRYSRKSLGLVKSSHRSSGRHCSCGRKMCRDLDAHNKCCHCYRFEGQHAFGPWECNVSYGPISTIERLPYLLIYRPLKALFVRTFSQRKREQVPS